VKIVIGELELTSEYKAMRDTEIVITKNGVKVAGIDSKELITAIEALEKTCWRP
jgi:hypothetical protein